MNRWPKFTISTVFMLSALAKLIDFDNTVVYFQRLSGFGSQTVEISIALLLFIEMLIAFTLPIDCRFQTMIQDATLLLLAFFLGLSLTLTFTGIKSCGCFGTYWVSHPWLTVVKNVVLITIMIISRYDGGANKYA